MPALVLAYIGDAVYELVIRSYLVGTGAVKVKRLHNEAVRLVNAKTQARVLRALDGRLTDEEAAVMRRGRNSRSPHTPRSAGVIEYRQSTALECLIGYLYLKGDTARINEIIKVGLDVVGANKPSDAGRRASDDC
ncbi:MAG: ribonuclease III domain-containing protein [Desulfotomaculaceae bacterium]|nr:ribonuclease III domain-containing protein [Desulfotomaculaceae bacterium]